VLWVGGGAGGAATGGRTGGGRDTGGGDQEVDGTPLCGETWGGGRSTTTGGKGGTGKGITYIYFKGIDYLGRERFCYLVKGTT
jgi:hypothetical protein